MSPEEDGPTDASARQSDGGTPLDAEELEGLKPTYITTKGELDQAEAANIAKAYRRMRRARLAGLRDAVLDDLFVRRLHKEMFGEVWTWAGSYRVSEKNLGVDPAMIAVRVRALVDDVRTWCRPQPGRWSDDEIAARMHHTMVVIHPFPNGNGRHARLHSDYLARALGRPPFTWGSAELTRGQARERYLRALRSADAGDLTPLLAFVRS